jgi:hypothetical protein
VKLRLALVLLLFPLAGIAQVTPGVDDAPGTLSNKTISCASNTLTGLLSQCQVFDTRTYGAKCDGSTDDSAAWQSAINAAAAITTVTNVPLSAIILGCQGQSVVKTTLNLTGFSGFSSPFALGLIFDMTGTSIICETNGTPCIDAISSRYLTFRHLNLATTTATRLPNWGLLIGRSSTNSADNIYLERPSIQGNFTAGAMLNVASESMTMIDPWIQDNYTSGTPFAYVEDGYNHFNVCSLTLAASCTIATDTPVSFQQSTVLGGWIGVSTAGAALWLGNTSQHRFLGTYLLSSTSSGSNVYLYTEGSGTNRNLELDVHSENSAVANTFLLTGGASAPYMVNFKYMDNYSEATTSLFKLDTGVTSAAMYDSTIKIDYFSGGNSVAVFAAPSAWTFNGEVYVPNSGNWTTPATWQGCVNIVGAISCNYGAISLAGTALGTFATQNYATPPAIGGTTPAAVSGTTLTATAAVVAPVSSGSTDSYQVAGGTGTGIYFPNTTSVDICANANCGLGVTSSGQARMIGTGLVMVGTKFTVGGTCSTPASVLGGANAGTIQLASSGTTSSCTLIITIAGATGSTAPNGWSCWADDQTKGATGMEYVAQTASSATTATLTLSSLTSASDVISYGCLGY